ncbi:T-cell surface protein tactile, partial [Galemys pyrenaicus]
IWGETSNAQNIYVSPGSDLNLTCQTEKKGFLVQMQWSKISSKEELIAVYHPRHGYYCANVSSCDSLVAFTEAPGKVSVWTLHLRNVSSSLSGKYECTFTLYPEGIRMHTYNVLIQTPVTQDEQRRNHTIEIEINQSLEIPCFQNITSEISSEFTFTWLVEDNRTQEILISKYSGNTQHHLISNSTSFKDRVKLGTNYSLQLSPVQVYDNDLTFSCCIKVSPGKILRSFTKVKVFAKPEVPVIAENNSMDDLGKRTFTCLLNNVFPTANLTWFIDGSSPQGEKGISITTEKRIDKGGFLELRSVLTRVSDNQPAQSSNLAIWCTALAPVPGNKVSNITSEKIMFSLGKLSI